MSVFKSRYIGFFIMFYKTQKLVMHTVYI